jgi:hypothetical protein
MHVERLERAVRDLYDLRTPKRRELIESALAVNDPRAFGPQREKCLSDELGVLRARDPDELTARARGVGTPAG